MGDCNCDGNPPGPSSQACPTLPSDPTIPSPQLNWTPNEFSYNINSGGSTTIDWNAPTITQDAFSGAVDGTPPDVPDYSSDSGGSPQGVSGNGVGSGTVTALSVSPPTAGLAGTIGYSGSFSYGDIPTYAIPYVDVTPVALPEPDLSQQINWSYVDPTLLPYDVESHAIDYRNDALGKANLIWQMPYDVVTAMGYSNATLPETGREITHGRELANTLLDGVIQWNTAITNRIDAEIELNEGNDAARALSIKSALLAEKQKQDIRLNNLKYKVLSEHYQAQLERDKIGRAIEIADIKHDMAELKADQILNQRYDLKKQSMQIEERAINIIADIQDINGNIRVINAQMQEKAAEGSYYAAQIAGKLATRDKISAEVDEEIASQSAINANIEALMAKTDYPTEIIPALNEEVDAFNEWVTAINDRYDAEADNVSALFDSLSTLKENLISEKASNESMLKTEAKKKQVAGQMRVQNMVMDMMRQITEMQTKLGDATGDLERSRAEATRTMAAARLQAEADCERISAAMIEAQAEIDAQKALAEAKICATLTESLV